MEGMTVLIVGSGGREHAISIGLHQSNSVGSIHIAPGNAGTAMVGTNHPVEASNIDGLSAWREIGSDLVVIGPEGPLVEGITDRLRKSRYLVSSLTQRCDVGRIENAYKDLMKQLRIPTAAMARLDHDSDIKIFLLKPSSMGGKERCLGRRKGSGDIEIDEAERLF